MEKIPGHFGKSRLEAFSDGVLAIIITIMVLEFKVPHGTELSDLTPLIPTFFSYVLSFVYVGIYWNNHHHMFQVVREIDGGAMWANSHLLFWLSLTPFVTAWAGENQFAPIPVATYGFVLMMCGIAYFILVKSLLRVHDKSSVLAKAVGNDVKGKVSVILNAIGIIAACRLPWLGCLFYVGVAIMWLIPDRRIEKALPQ